MVAPPAVAPLIGALLGWLAGVALQMQRADLLPAPPMLALAAAALVAGWALVLLRRHGRPPQRATWPAATLCALLMAVAGAASTEGRAGLRLAERLAPALEGQDLWVTGVVARLPQSNPAGTRFLFEVESARQQDRAVPLPPRLMLGWYHGADAGGPLLGPERLRAGQRWQLPLRLRQPHGNLNPQGFDYELWLFEQGVGATGYVRARAGQPARLLADDAGHPVERLRQRVCERIEARIADPNAAGVLAALAVGDQGAIDRSDWDLFRITGLAHLVAVSGLHITMFAWLAAAVGGWAWRRSPRLMLWLPAPLAGRWAGLALAAAYALLAGWGVPAQRTVLMIAVVVLLRSLGLRWPGPLLLLWAAVAVTVLDPWALLQPGFWLSFVAVGLLMLSDPARPPPPGASWRQRLRAAVQGGVHTQAVATVGLAPLGLIFFGQLSLVGFVANLVAIPLVTLVITPLALLGMLLPALWQPAALLVQALLAGAGTLAAWPWATWAAAGAPAWAAALGLLGGALLVMPLPPRLRLLGLPLLLPLLAPPLERPPEGRFELLALDVGQGTAVLVRTRQHLLVYDAGPLYGPESDAGQRVLLPLLRARGEARIDRLLLSHSDSDHTGGAAALLARWPVGVLHSSLPAAHPLRAAPVAQQPCRAGQRWQWDGVDFEILFPFDPTDVARPNTVSCVLRVRGAQGSALLAGDIERAQELALVQQLGDGLRSDWLLVPHHGSKTSSGDAFLAAVQPRLALVQAGYRSRFGHPAPEVVARYAARGITLLRTDSCGAWTWAADGGMHCQRRLAARYWHHRAGNGLTQSQAGQGSDR